MGGTGLIRVGMLVVAGLLTGAVARAQSVAQSFAGLEGALRVGEVVVVTDEKGRKTRGEIAEVAPTLLVLRTRDEIGTTRRAAFDAAGVRQIRRTDSLWNGILIGAGVGLGATIGITRYRCGGGDPECTANAGGVFGMILIPAAAGLGALVDAMIGNEVLYRASPAGTRLPPVTVAPRVGKGEVGLSLSARF